MLQEQVKQSSTRLSLDSESGLNISTKRRKTPSIMSQKFFPPDFFQTIPVNQEFPQAESDFADKTVFKQIKRLRTLPARP
jgi:hypothetical protein